MRVRVFFDWGAGVCCWAGDDEAEAAFGYAIETGELPVSRELVAEVEAMIVRHLGSLDASDPGGPTPWSQAELASFVDDAAALVGRLRAELGPAWDVVDEIQRG